MRLAVALASFALGCAADPTATIVQIDATEVTRLRSTSLRLELGAPGQPPSYTREGQVGVDFEWPAVVTATPEGDQTVFELTGTLIDASGPFNELRDVFPFRRGQTLQFEVSFDDACDLGRCGAGERCEAGACVEIGECDEGATRSCGSVGGACRAGEQACVAGVWGRCVGRIAPREEQCDPDASGGILDEDCDGIVDEGCAFQAEVSGADGGTHPGLGRVGDELLVVFAGPGHDVIRASRHDLAGRSLGAPATLRPTVASSPVERPDVDGGDSRYRIAFTEDGDVDELRAFDWLAGTDDVTELDVTTSPQFELCPPHTVRVSVRGQAVAHVGGDEFVRLYEVSHYPDWLPFVDRFDAVSRPTLTFCNQNVQRASITHSDSGLLTVHRVAPHEVVDPNRFSLSIARLDPSDARELHREFVGGLGLYEESAAAGALIGELAGVCWSTRVAETETDVWFQLFETEREPVREPERLGRLTGDVSAQVLVDGETFVVVVGVRGGDDAFFAYRVGLDRRMVEARLRLTVVNAAPDAGRAPFEARLVGDRLAIVWEETPPAGPPRVLLGVVDAPPPL